MIQKATSLVDIFNVFTPRALTEEDREFYQETAHVRDGANYEFYQSLYKRIESSRSKAHLLVVGHPGCGKSTELRMLAAKLRDEGNYPSITIEVRDDNLDLFALTYIDIFMLVVQRLAEHAAKSNLKIDERIIAAFNDALSTETINSYKVEETGTSGEAGVSASLTLPGFLNIISRITTSFSTGSGVRENLRREINPKMPEITLAINALIDNINDQNNQKNNRRNMVIIIDGLEKCRQDNVRKLFSDDISAMASINTHLILTCPINVYRSADLAAIHGYFARPNFMPMIKIHHNNKERKLYDEGVAVIKNLIHKRVDSLYFEIDVLDTIIAMAGGNLRQTCMFLSDCAFEAYMRERTTIDMDSVIFTLNKHAVDLFLSAKNDYYPAMKKIYDGDHHLQNDADLSELLYTSVVFEYNGERWIDLHPLVRQFIDKRPGVLD